jgi:tetratricopeptide (TPR) repeat protein
VHGLLAMLALIGMAVWLTARATAAAAENDTDGAAWLAYGSAAGVAAIFGICGDALFSFPLQLPAPTFLFALHLGVIGAAEAQLSGRKMWGEDDEVARGPQPAGTGVKWGLTAVAVAGLMFLNGFGNWEGLHPRWMVAEHGFTKGRSLQKNGRASEGLTEIRRAIQYNPDDFQNHFIEGLNLNSLGRTQEAIKSIENSLALYPYLLNAWVNLAMFNARLDNDKAMNAAIDKALALKPDELVALNVRADWLMERGQHKEALALLARHVAPPPGGKVDPAKPLHKMSYVEYRMAGHFPPDDPQVLAQYIRTLKNAAKAAQQLERWNDVAACTEALLREPIPNDGRSEFDKRMEWMRRHGDMADALGKAGRWQEAVEHARLAAELAQSDKAAPKIQYGHVLARTGDIEGAKREYRIGVRMDKSLLAEATEQLGKLKVDEPGKAGAWDNILAEVRAL